MRTFGTDRQTDGRTDRLTDGPGYIRTRLEEGETRLEEGES